MIEIVDIKKSFGDKEVLKGINGTFQKGKTNLIIGGSGTGKSVLLKSIVGLVTPDHGQVLYDGRDFHSASITEKKSIRSEIGMLFQGGALFDSKTVEQNVLFPLEMTQPKMSQSEKMDRVNECLKRVQLENVNHLTPSEISGGMQKRVGIARAIVLNPRYLFVDEPNSGLDPLTAIKIDELIHEITIEFDITTVVVTHDMNSMIDIGDHIMFLYKGLKLWEGTKDDILESDVPEFNEFVFANALVKAIKKVK